MAESPPSIVEVAQRAGTSLATASRVLNNAPHPISAATRERVLRAARELNYVPNPLARSLRAKRSNLIAILVGDSSDPYFAEITRGVETVANEHGYLTIVCNADRSLEKERNYLRVLRDYRVDGVLFTASGSRDSVYAERIAEAVAPLVQRGVAVVTLSDHTLDVPSILPDNQGGARRMTERLIALGHRKIVHLRGPEQLVVAEVRLRGYQEAMQRAGIALDPAWGVVSGYERSDGERAAAALMRLPAEHRPTAIFTGNDETALGVLSELRALGLRVPGDVSVCGFGDLPLAQYSVPSLTSVRIALEHLGRVGAEKVFALLRHEEVERHEITPTTIIERDSIGPAPRSRLRA